MLAQEKLFSLYCLEIFEALDKYYSRQGIMLHATGHARQRGGGFGSLALDVGRVALSFAKRVLLTAIRLIIKEVFVQGSPEIMEIATKKKSFKGAAKAALRMTVRKQIGRGERSVNRNIRQKLKLLRFRSDFFSKVNNVTELSTS